MQAVRSEGEGGHRPHRHRLLHGRDWVSPYQVERAALRRVTRSEPAEFRPSRGVVILGDPPTDANVVDLTARRAQRATAAGRSAGIHPSGWQRA